MPRRGKTRPQVERALAERRLNAQAARAGEPLPYPNIWDELDPTKVPRDASQEEIQRSYAEFRRLCPPRPRKRHAL